MVCAHHMQHRVDVGCAEVRIRRAACLAVTSRACRIAGSLPMLQALAFTSIPSLWLYLIRRKWHLKGSVACRRCMVRSSWSHSRLRQPRLLRLLFWKSGAPWLGCARLRMLSTSKPSSSGGSWAQLALEVCCLPSSVHALGAGAAVFPSCLAAGQAAASTQKPSRVVRVSVEEGSCSASRHSGQASMHDAEQHVLIQRQQQHANQA